jgi:hypothetical protein
MSDETLSAIIDKLVQINAAQSERMNILSERLDTVHERLTRLEEKSK